jgi:hypothetical protein
VIIYKFTQGNLGAKKNRQSRKKISNCGIGDRQRDPCIHYHESGIKHQKP